MGRKLRHLTSAMAASQIEGTGRGTQEALVEGPDDVAVGSGYPAAVGQAVDPFGMLKSAADLVNPVAAARELPWLVGEWLRVALGRSSVWFDEKDSRFADVTWRANVLYHR